MSNLFVEAMRGRQAYGRRSGVGELYNLRAISRSDLRRCSHVELHRGKNGLDHRRRMGGSDPRGDDPVHIGWTFRISSGVSQGIDKSVVQSDWEFLRIGVDGRR